MPSFTAAELARRLQGEVRGEASVELHGLAAADTAGPGDLTFAESEAFLVRAESSAAGAILTSLEAGPAKTVIRVRHTRLAMAQALALFYPEPAFAPGLHPSAVVDPGARIDPTAHVGPLCAIGSGSELGPRVVLMAGVVVGANCVLGADTRVFPRVILYDRTHVGARVRIHAGAVLGSDGYGYVFANGAHQKVPQVGQVVIEDDVEIGANVTIDRAALGATVIGHGTKVDNLVHVAHNVTVGSHCLLIAQVGIAGSTTVGDYVTMAGQVGISDHLRIGNRVTIGAQAGVMSHIPDGETWLGAPARPVAQMMRQFATAEKLPELARRLAALERQVAAQRAEPAKP